MTARVGIYGEVPGFPAGSLFANRQELSDCLVHRQTQKGIVGTAAAGGAESIVLSGGYEDDEDYDDFIVYTGEGKRDPKSGRQIAHQELSGGNLALMLNRDRGMPVRVVRKASATTQRKFDSGYRYDGLFIVESMSHEIGRAGFLIYRYRLLRNIYAELRAKTGSDVEYSPAERSLILSQRIVRSTRVGQEVKAIHKNTCQVCATQLRVPSGLYSEGAHIRPLGRPHDGPDRPENVLCLCPNHHVQFDRGTFSVSDKLELVGLDGELRTTTKHKIDLGFLAYHRDHCYQRVTIG